MALATDIRSITKSVTKKWTAQRKREERESRTRYSRREYLYSTRVNQTDVADQVIPQAYAKASNDGKLPAHARQIFYAARKEIQDRTDRPLNSVYFTQTLLPKFMNRHPELTQDWWVVYDARGHLLEPHTETNIALGTLAVDRYLSDIASHCVTDPGLQSLKTEYPTKGPLRRYSAILFIEKEGFNPLFKEVKLADRYDLAIMSTKGQSVTAARRLVDELCPEGGDVKLLVLHDFDKEGFSISQSLTSNSAAAYASDRVRYEFRNRIKVIDLGLRLGDIQQWNLETESVHFKGNFDRDTIATPEEQEFLRGNQRVELNAFTSADLIKWIESKLKEHGIAKVVPDESTLEEAYRRAYQISLVNQQLAEINQDARVQADAAEIPSDLENEVREALEDSPAQSWDEAVADLADEASEETDKPKSKKRGSRQSNKPASSGTRRKTNSYKKGKRQTKKRGQRPRKET